MAAALCDAQLIKSAVRRMVMAYEDSGGRWKCCCARLDPGFCGFVKNTAHQPIKRKLLAMLAGLPLFTACVPAEVRAARKAGEERRKAYYNSLSPKEQATLQRFRGIGIQLVVDAVEGAKMEGVKIDSDNGYSIFSSGSVSQGKSISDAGSARVPLWVRVVWRDKPKAIWGKDGGIDWDGPIIGDYTIPVAERIPDEVVESLRNDPRGSLRIKASPKRGLLWLGHRAAARL